MVFPIPMRARPVAVGSNPGGRLTRQTVKSGRQSSGERVVTVVTANWQAFGAGAVGSITFGRGFAGTAALKPVVIVSETT